MGVETVTYVSDLVVTNPLASDLESQGDDHLRLIKTALKQTFLDTFTSGVYLPKITSAADALALMTLQEYGPDFPIVNGAIVASVAGNALTIALKTDTGADPSASNPAYFTFKNVGATDGNYSGVIVSAAASVVVSSGSTLGASNGVAFKLAVVGFNDGGTFRLGVVNVKNLSLDTSLLLSSTAEGGVGAADSADVVYSGVAVASKSFRVLGYLKWSSGLATAGTWNAAPSVQYSGALPVERPVNKVVLQSFTANGTYTPTLGMKYCLMYTVGGGGGGGGVNTSSGLGSGGGGGGGSASVAVKTAAQVGASQTVTVGASAAGGIASNPGAAGNDSSIGALCVGKGGGFGQGVVANGRGAPGAGGVAGTGDVKVPGQAGGDGSSSAGITVGAPAGTGGSAGLGFGAGASAVTASAATDGRAGGVYGGGGGGASSYNSGGNGAGGAGAQGICFVLEYCVE